MQRYDIATSDSSKYVYTPLPDFHTLHFQVKALCNAFVTLSKQALPEECEPVLQVFFGVKGNQQTLIRRDRRKPNKATVDSPGILSGKEYRGFWINFLGGNIQVGKEKEVQPFLTWSDPNPVSVMYFGVCTGYGVEGKWISNGEKFRTSGSLEYMYRPVRRFHLDLFVAAQQNACIAFTSGLNDTSPMYEVALGANNNQMSCIRYNKDRFVAQVATPNVLSNNHYRQFLVSCNQGLVRVTRGNSCDVVMEWQDPNPFIVTAFGVKTYEATGYWTIYIVNDLAQDKQELRWVTAREDNKKPPPDAVKGVEDAGFKEYVGRHIKASDKPAIVPGRIRDGQIMYVWENQEVSSSTFDYLTGNHFKWKEMEDGATIPDNAVIGGNTKNLDPLYIGRAHVDGEHLSIGMVQSTNGALYVPKNQQVHKFTEYEILVVGSE